MLIICFVILLSVVLSPATENIAKLPNCAEKDSNRGWILVSTLDGKLSALDYNDSGREIWNIETGPGPLLSSNIDRLELTSNGHWVRIIPSLAGSLYKFNGDTIDAIPITADSLLTSSFRYLDDLVIAGGKEVRTYGVLLNSGQLLYECSIDGCKNKTDYVNYEDLILLERNTQTVRAVEPRSGLERWNFSVGQLNLRIPEISCHSDINDQSIKFNMKAVVPEGLVYAFGSSNQILWKKQFASPIVNVWTYNGKDFKPVDLFSGSQYSWSMNSNNVSPVLYIGMHKKQLYIHESVILQKFLTSSQNKDRNQLSEIGSISKIPWRPFPASSSSLAVANIENTKNIDDIEAANQIATTALSVLYGSEYVNGNGFYLYTSDILDKQNSDQCENNITIHLLEDKSGENNNEEDDDDDTPVQVIIVSLWYWWKEVSVIAITTAFAFNLIINQNLFRRFRIRGDSQSTSRLLEESSVSSRDVNPPAYTKSVSESSDKEFESRYLTDFDPLHCLGKGGFGVVFEARNKIDECSYAVKRITLPNKLESRERVMREVKALAKLDHRNIVRYFNAWLESPPPEWIDEFDRVWNQDPLTETGGLDYSTTTATATKSPQAKKNDASVVIDFTRSDISKCYTSFDFKQSENMCSDASFIVFESSSKSERTSSTFEDDKRDTHNKRDTESCSRSSTKPDNGIVSKKSKSPSTLYASGKVFLYIQMQLCQKKSLRDWLRDNVSRKNNEILSIFEQTVLAVEYVHLKGLIHRDLKPSNIFFSMEGEVKIGDFGLVTGMEECPGDKLDLEKNGDALEKHTQAVGTQLYMSPEQLNGLSYNYKVDIYSLGVILFELLVPFHTAMERNKTLSDLRKCVFPDQFCQDFHQEYQLLLLMLSESPEKRPTTFGIRARPPLHQGPVRTSIDSVDAVDSNSTETCDYYFELPPRQ